MAETRRDGEIIYNRALDMSVEKMSFCSLGAIERATMELGFDSGFDSAVCQRAETRLKKCIPNKKNLSIAMFKDASKTHKKDVLAMFDCAIETR